jgi:hypothetical protein
MRKQLQTKTVRDLINKFELTGDLCFLADAILLGSKILKDNAFPIEIYKRYEERKHPKRNKKNKK